MGVSSGVYVQIRQSVFPEADSVLAFGLARMFFVCEIEDIASVEIQVSSCGQGLDLHTWKPYE